MMDLLYFGAEPEDLDRVDKLMKDMKERFPEAKVYDGTDGVMAVIETVIAVEGPDSMKEEFDEYLVEKGIRGASLSVGLSKITLKGG